ncbi:MAG TPA: sortase [Dongiaceae bacterium]|nr:sortase [Dongiaceae bacterium]
MIPRLLSGAALAALLCGGVLLGRDLYLRSKGALAGVLIDRAWAARLDDGRLHRPWPWADFTPVARLEVGRLGIDAPILSDATGRTMAFGLGWIVGSAPLDAVAGSAAATGPAGRFGVTAVGGHRDTGAAFLEDLRVGDTLVLRTGAAPQRFRVVSLDVVDARAARVAPPSDAAVDDGRRLLLVTCWPFRAAWHGNQRFVVECALES